MNDAALQASVTAIDDFIEALFLEDGLSANTLQAYRRDVMACAQFLAQSPAACSLLQAQEQDLQAFLQQRHALGVKAVSSNRGLSVLRRFFTGLCVKVGARTTPPYACWRPNALCGCRIP
jgi:Site-specific recombinase XerD